MSANCSIWKQQQVGVLMFQWNCISLQNFSSSSPCPLPSLFPAFQVSSRHCIFSSHHSSLTPLDAKQNNKYRKYMTMEMTNIMQTHRFGWDSLLQLSQPIQQEAAPQAQLFASRWTISHNLEKAKCVCKVFTRACTNVK